ncbi:UNVERIFIED_CONTAM: hypothetical protein HDU68_012245 [Siphonaria sp. JEL0065]|nr:hypothetical protein HDU68_012245 [Siphonaria sp. JEL0065]
MTPNQNANSKRAEQNRRAQQAYRQRKEALVTDLQNQVAQLKESSQKAKNLVVTLKQKVADLEYENAVLKDALASNVSSPPLSQAASSASIANPASMVLDLFNQIPDWDWLSLYLANIPPHPLPSEDGSDQTLQQQTADTPTVTVPLPASHPLTMSQFNAVKLELKRIQNLETLPAIDTFFELFVAQSRETDLERIKNEIIALADTRYKILDGCEFQDRPKAIAILQSVWDDSPEHVKRMNDVIDALGARQHAKRLLQPFLRMNPHTIHADVSWFRVGASHIESLKNPDAVEAVNQLCDCFLQQINLVDPVEQREGFMRMMQLQNKVYSLCKNSEEMNLAQSSESDLITIKSNIIASSALWFKILDSCELRDRPVAIDIMQDALRLKFTQVESVKPYIIETSKHQQPLPPKRIAVNVDLFRNAISHIPSLKTPEATAVVQELCDSFKNQLTLTNEIEKREGFLNLMALESRLYALCKNEDDRKAVELLCLAAMTLKYSSSSSPASSVSVVSSTPSLRQTQSPPPNRKPTRREKQQQKEMAALYAIADKLADLEESSRKNKIMLMDLQVRINSLEKESFLRRKAILSMRDTSSLMASASLLLEAAAQSRSVQVQPQPPTTARSSCEAALMALYGQS